MSLCEKLEHLGSYVNFITTFREGGNERQEIHLKVFVDWDLWVMTQEMKAICKVFYFFYFLFFFHKAHSVYPIRYSLFYLIFSTPFNFDNRKERTKMFAIVYQSYLLSWQQVMLTWFPFIVMSSSSSWFLWCVCRGFGTFKPANVWRLTLVTRVQNSAFHPPFLWQMGNTL